MPLASHMFSFSCDARVATLAQGAVAHLDTNTCTRLFNALKLYMLKKKQQQI